MAHALPAALYTGVSSGREESSEPVRAEIWISLRVRRSVSSICSAEEPAERRVIPRPRAEPAERGAGVAHRDENLPVLLELLAQLHKRLVVPLEVRHRVLDSPGGLLI